MKNPVLWISWKKTILEFVAHSKEMSSEKQENKILVFLQGRKIDILQSLILFYSSSGVMNEECISPVFAFSFQTPYIVLLTGIEIGTLKIC